MYKLKINLLYKHEDCFCTTTELLNCKITLLFAKLELADSRLVSNDLIFSAYIPVDIQLVTFLLLSNVSELIIGEKPSNNHRCLKNIFYLTKNHIHLLMLVVFLLDQLLSFLPLQV